MRLGIVITGIVFILFAIPGYEMSPNFITKGMNSFSGGADSTSSPYTSSLLAQMGIPPADEISQLTQYSFVGLAVAGIGALIFGIIVKAVPKQGPVKMGIELNVQKPEKEEKDDRSKALRLLKERLAKGEITSSQYANLKDLLDRE